MGNIMLTGDRPTGKLHLGHYVGSLRRRVELQDDPDMGEMFIMIADGQALTDNAGTPQKIRDNILEVALDYFSCGIDPSKTTVFIQTFLPELFEMTAYFSNLVTLARLERNPTVKNEIQMRGFKSSIPVGFLTYPISQTSDIVAFKANIVPVGEDQLPMLEQAREIVRSFNATYGEVLVEPQAMLPDNEFALRLPGTDGHAKMSKSLGNCIYLSDDSDTVKQKVMGMYTDPNHIHKDDPGKVEGNPVFTYLEAFVKEDSFENFLPEYANLDELKDHYRRGGLGDVKIKKFLIKVLEDELAPIRERRHELEKNVVGIYEALFAGSRYARRVASDTLDEIRDAIGVNYFDDKELIESQQRLYNEKHNQ